MNTNDNLTANFAVGFEINFNAEVLKSNLCYYNNAYILVTGGITAKAAPAVRVTFKNCALFTKYIKNIDGATVDDAEDLDLVKPM